MKISYKIKYLGNRFIYSAPCIIIHFVGRSSSSPPRKLQIRLYQVLYEMMEPKYDRGDNIIRANFYI